MNLPEYIGARNALIASFRSFNINENETLNGQFNLASASLLNFMPEIPFASHGGIFQNILLHKKLSILEQQSFTVLDFVETENLNERILNSLKSTPSVVCTFHIGSYRVINLFLVRHKIPFTLVIGKDISEQEGTTFSKLFNYLNSDNENSFRIINAESAGAGIQMLRELKQNRTLVLYIDGNSGAGSTTNQNENSCTIQFLQKQIFTRKGISFLAHLAGVPILTVASYRPTPEKIRLRFFDPIVPDQNMDRDQFAIKSTQRIYDNVAPLIKSYPEQWEGWLFLHKVANIKKQPTAIHTIDDVHINTGKFLFNSGQFGIFKVQKIPFLLRKANYSLYEITTDLFDRLTECKEHPADMKRFEQDVFNQLYEQGVLVQA